MRAILVALAAILGGCGGSGGLAFGPRDQVTDPVPAFVRFVNAAPSSADITISIPITGRVVSNIPYRDVMPPRFLPIPSDNAAVFSVKDNSAGSIIICQLPYNLSPGSYYTVVIAGTLGKAGNQQLQCQVFIEQFAPAAPGKIQLIAHYAAPAFFAVSGAPTLQVGHFDPGQTPAASTAPGMSTTGLGNPDVSVTFSPGFVGPFPAANGVSQSAIFAALSDGQLGLYVAHKNVIDATVLPRDAILGGGNPGALPDMANLFPIAGTTTISVYAIDGTSAGTPLQLLAIFD